VGATSFSNNFHQNPFAAIAVKDSFPETEVEFAVGDGYDDNAYRVKKQ
jgi:hypothetical protein